MTLHANAVEQTLLPSSRAQNLIKSRGNAKKETSKSKKAAFNKKTDRLLYKATALDAPAITSAEQPIEGGSLSSAGKGSDNSASD